MVRTTAGKWILPQPIAAKNTGEYVSIPKLSTVWIPFGYKVNETDPDVLDPIPAELEALEQAKKYLKQYPSRYVAAWLTKVTGRSISHAGLLKRIKHEQRNKAKAASLRRWAARYKRAIEEAEKYEKRTGNKYVTNARAVIDQVDRDHGIE